MGGIKTHIFCLADTHGKGLDTIPHCRFDVVLHCGDLTNTSCLSQLRSAIKLLKSLDAPLKLVIPGNHDTSLDPEVFWSTPSKSSVKAYGFHRDAWKLFQDAREWGIMLLTTGIHRFRLDNGALLAIYANPYTPSEKCDGAFQYRNGGGLSYFQDLQEPVDIVMSHGPPHGILDWSYEACHLGCADLRDAIIRTRPLLHVFGHVHEDWGAKYIPWREAYGRYAMDLEESQRIRKQMDYLDGGREARLHRQLCHERGYECTRHCYDDEMPLCRRRNATLFVNAAIGGRRGSERQRLPWLVELELPAA